MFTAPKQVSEKEHFTGEEIVFLLAERDQDRKPHYAVLENSTLLHTEDRVHKLRLIRRSYLSRQRVRQMVYLVRERSDSQSKLLTF